MQYGARWIHEAHALGQTSLWPKYRDDSGVCGGARDQSWLGASCTQWDAVGGDDLDVGVGVCVSVVVLESNASWVEGKTFLLLALTWWFGQYFNVDWVPESSPEDKLG